MTSPYRGIIQIPCNYNSCAGYHFCLIDRNFLCYLSWTEHVPNFPQRFADLMTSHWRYKKWKDFFPFNYAPTIIKKSKFEALIPVLQHVTLQYVTLVYIVNVYRSSKNAHTISLVTGSLVRRQLVTTSTMLSWSLGKRSISCCKKKDKITR